MDNCVLGNHGLLGRNVKVGCSKGKGGWSRNKRGRKAECKPMDGRKGLIGVGFYF